MKPTAQIFDTPFGLFVGARRFAIVLNFKNFLLGTLFESVRLGGGLVFGFSHGFRVHKVIPILPWFLAYSKFVTVVVVLSEIGHFLAQFFF